MNTITAVLWCAAALLVLRFSHNKSHNQIHITSHTKLLPTNERPGVPYHIVAVGQFACPQLVGHYVACLTLWAWLERADEVPGTAGTKIDD